MIKRIRISAILTILAMLTCNRMIGSALILSSAEPTVYASHATGKVGDVVEVLISLENNPGVVAMQLTVTYNEAALKLVGVIDEGKLGQAMHTSNLLLNPYPLTWMNGLALTNFNNNGVITKLRFEILAEAGNYPITITSKGIYNQAMQAVRFDIVNGSVTSQAVTSDPVTHTVTFLDWNGTVLKTETVNHGSSATAPANPIREGYTFTGWDKTFNNVINDLTVKAQYKANTSDPVTRTVIFLDWNGAELKTETVNHGSSATAPANPAREGYTFTGWDKAFDNVTSDLTVTAQYEAVTLVHNPVSQAVLSAYPNPVSKGSTLNIEGVAKGSHIEVYNVQGACVCRTIATENPAQLMLDVPAGIYIVRTHNGEIKIIINI